MKKKVRKGAIGDVPLLYESKKKLFFYLTANIWILSFKE